MPFTQVNVKDKINSRLIEDERLYTAYKAALQQYELIKQLKEIRKKKGISQKEISKITGMSQQAVSRIETMEHSPNLLNFLIYVRALGCRIRIEPEPLCDK